MSRGYGAWGMLPRVKVYMARGYEAACKGLRQRIWVEGFKSGGAQGFKVEG